MDTTTLTVLDRIDLEQVRGIAQKIQQFHQFLLGSLTKGQDYGEIPGTAKPTLLLPGAQRVAMLLQLVPSYEVLERVHDLTTGYLRFEVACTLSRDGLPVSQGLGSCSSFETKYRWKWVSEAEAAAMGAESAMVRKDDYGRTKVRVQKQDEIFDIENVVLKISAKRAYVSSVLSVAALTGVFTQDLEDLPAAVVQPERTEAAPASDVGGYTIRFGTKHKGETLAQVAKTDRGYLEWLASSASSQEIRTVVRKFLTDNAVVAKAPAPKPVPVPAKAMEARAETPGDDDTNLPFDL
jgi:hypothetical protein